MPTRLTRTLRGPLVGAAAAAGVALSTGTTAAAEGPLLPPIAATCDGEAVLLVPEGRGLFAAARVVGTNQVMVPLSFTRVFTLDGDVVGTRQLATKSADPGIETVICSFVQSVDSETGVVTTLVVTGFVRPPD
jgi:hypothetical protein